MSKEREGEGGRFGFFRRLNCEIVCFEVIPRFGVQRGSKRAGARHKVRCQVAFARDMLNRVVESLSVDCLFEQTRGLQVFLAEIFHSLAVSQDMLPLHLTHLKPPTQAFELDSREPDTLPFIKQS